MYLLQLTIFTSLWAVTLTDSYHYKNLLPHNITYAMLGCDRHPIPDFTMMVECAIGCTHTNTCLAFSWTADDPTRCIQCRVPDQLTWAMDVNAPDTGDYIQYIILDKRTLRGTYINVMLFYYIIFI